MPTVSCCRNTLCAQLISKAVVTNRTTTRKLKRMAIARVHPAFGDVRFGELSHQLDFCFSLFPCSCTCALLRTVSGRAGMLVCFSAPACLLPSLSNSRLFSVFLLTATQQQTERRPPPPRPSTPPTTQKAAKQKHEASNHLSCIWKSRVQVEEGPQKCQVDVGQPLECWGATSFREK